MRLSSCKKKKFVQSRKDIYNTKNTSTLRALLCFNIIVKVGQYRVSKFCLTFFVNIMKKTPTFGIIHLSGRTYPSYSNCFITFLLATFQLSTNPLSILKPSFHVVFHVCNGFHFQHQIIHLKNKTAYEFKKQYLWPQIQRSPGKNFLQKVAISIKL